MVISRKARRIFSEDLKQALVKQIEAGKLRVIDVCREYSVSDAAVYNWLNRYSRHLQKGETIVIQKDSEEQKNHELRKRIAELERIIGQKQMEVDFLNKVIELGSQEVKVDIKKKYGGGLSSGSGPIKENTAGK